jgi:hypothetical protein
MKARFPGVKARMAVLLSAAVLLAGAAAFASELFGRYRWANEVLESIEPRYARLKGLEAVGDEILRNRALVDAGLARIAHPADSEVGRVGTDLQQRIRRIADDHDVRVSGSQILAPRADNGFMAISVTATMDGETQALGTFVLALASEEPPIIVEKLLVQAPRPTRRGEVNTRVTAQATMSVIRLLP